MGNAGFGVGVSADDNIIGGQFSPGHRNVISWNNIGVTSTGDNNTIRNNFVGTTADGMAAAGNSYAGIHVSGNDNVVGGPASNAGNVISGNADGVMITGDGNRIQGNYIGVAQDAITPLSNTSTGISFYGSATGNLIGGTGVGEGNIIANNLGRGVRLFQPKREFPCSKRDPRQCHARKRRTRDRPGRWWREP